MNQVFPHAYDARALFLDRSKTPTSRTGRCYILTKSWATLLRPFLEQDNLEQAGYETYCNVYLNGSVSIRYHFRRTWGAINEQPCRVARMSSDGFWLAEQLAQAQVCAEGGRDIMKQDSPPLPLTGVVVLDLSRVLAGPFCTLVLAQLGARILKVEMPGCGDDSRAFGPFVNGKSLYFSALNYDKESIALNLHESADREIFERLLGRVDVLVENFRPGTMEKLGYGWELLHARHPNLIYAAVSGFGHTGPESRRAAYDMVVQGLGGIMSMTGQPDSPPTRVGVSIGDLAAALYLTIGILSALRKRDQGGGAVKVDVAMLDCQVALLETALTAYCCTGEVARPQGSRHPRIAPFQVYATGDSYLVLAAGNDRLFALMAQAMNRPDLLENANYQTNSLRRSHVELLEADMESTLRTRTTAEWLEVFTKAGVPCGPVNSVADVVRNPQVTARNMILSIADPVIGALKVAGNPIKMSGVAEPAHHQPPPPVDAHRNTILSWIREP